MLGSLFFQDSNECMRPFHTSVLDWLGDSEKAGDFLVDKQPGHQKLTDYLWKEYQQKGAQQLSGYALRNLPSHLAKAERWEDVVNLLCDLDFIQAKSAASLTFGLMDDFNTVLKSIPDNSENIQKEKERQKRLKKYSDDLISYA